jgi:hypothetical protein
MPSESQSQTRRVWMLLHASWPNWTPARQLATISLQYASRIHALRKAGILIANRVEHRGGKKYGFYRLGAPPVPSNLERRRANQLEKPAQPAANLFGEDLAPDRSYRE